MLSLSRTFLYNAWHIGKVVLPLAIVSYLGYDLGHTQATRHGELQLAKLAERTSIDLKRAAELRQQALAVALAEQQRLSKQAQEVGWELIQTRAKLETTQRQLTQRIAHATRSDGERFTGLGPDSLRLYQGLLGYTAADLAADLPAADAGDAATAAEAPATETGLSPGDILNHAAEYGLWCQQLDAKLRAYLSLHATAQTEAQP